MRRLEPSRQLYDRFRREFAERKLDKSEQQDDEQNGSTYVQADDNLAIADGDGKGKGNKRRAKSRQRRDYLRQYVRWLGRYWPTAALLMVLSLLSAAMDMTHPLFLRFILDDVLLRTELATEQRMVYLHLTGLTFLSVILVGQVLNVVKDYRTRQLSTRVVNSLRRTLFDRMVRLPLGKLHDMKTGGIISRLTGDVNMTSGLLQLGLISPGVSLVRLVIALCMLFYLNWKLAMVALTILPVVMCASFVLSKRIRPIYRSIRDDASHVDARVGETFGGIRVVRGFQRELLEERSHAIGRHAMVRKQLFATRRELGLWSVWGFLIASINLVAVWFGGALQIAGQATIGDIMAFQLYAMLLLNPVWQIVNSFSELQRSLAAMERVFEVLGMEEDKPDVSGAADAPTDVQEIRFEHVDFHYNPGTPVLRDFDIAIPGGSTVALVGRSGAGKTTVTDLVARFYDPTAGRILLNGLDLRDLRLASFRQLLGIVQQEVFLFDGTVADNIAYARPTATDEEIRDAARRANAHEFIDELPQQYETRIGERGVRLSGGQAQRLSIARAILADPQILILDEATSNLDSESEQLIQDSIHELLVGRTTFVIAHRLSTVTDADLILVLDNGQIVEQGSHADLIHRNGLYASMVARQQESMGCGL
ncbi:MAG: ABC transporter ATP-binding protein [Planctomycetales bacterium]|nr:ABC transporter ATP-binding protein [Planctomycetales bacterium]